MNPNEEVPILSIIQKIKDGQLDPSLISKEERLQCVEALMLEGYTEAGLAQILKRSQKTIKRDLEEIRQKNMLTPSLDLAQKLIGEMVMNAKIHRSYLMRMARQKDGTIQEKSQAEFMAWHVSKEQIELLQSLGYLPLRPQEIIGEIVHRKDSIKDLEKEIAYTEDLTQSYEDVPEEIKVKMTEIKGQFKQEVEEIQRKEEDNGSSGSKDATDAGEKTTGPEL